VSRTSRDEAQRLPISIMEIVTAVRPDESAGAGAVRARVSAVANALSWSALGLVVVAAGLPGLWFTPLNHDVACALYYSRRMMAGDRLYRDIVDNNPPLVFYLSMPIEWLSQRTGLLETQALACALMALTLAVVWLSARVLDLDSRHSAAVRWTLLLSCIAAALLLPARDFGQREHVAFLLLVPYTILCSARASRIEGVGRVTALAIGAAATAGFGMKPHFGLVFLALLAYVVVRRRDWRAILTIENVAIVGGLSLYLAFILLWTPEYVTAMVPLAMQHYGAYTVSMSFLLDDTVVRLLVIALLLLVCCTRFVTGSGDAARIVRPLALVSLVFFGVYLLQVTPYRYHLLPSLGFYVMAVAVAIAAFARTLFARASGSGGRARARDLARLVTRAVVIMVCVVPGVVVGAEVLDTHRADRQNARSGFRSPLAWSLVDIVHKAAAGQPIFVLSSSVSPAFPLVNLSDTQWPYHYNALWLLPAYYHDDGNFGVAAYRRPDAQSPGEHAFFQTIVTDLQATPPAILIVDRSRFKQGFSAVDFDFLDYFSQSPELAALFREYEIIARVGPYEVYKRGATPHNPGS